MVTLTNELIRAAAGATARLAQGSEAAETVRAGLQLAVRLAAAAAPGPPPGDPSPVEAYDPDHISPPAREALRDGYAALRRLEAHPDHRDPRDLAAGAYALGRFSFWCRYAGHLALGSAVQDVALAAWPPAVDAERRLELTFRRAVTDVMGHVGVDHPIAAPVVADALEMQVRAAGMPALLPMADYLRAGHALKVARWAEAERLADSIIRRARRSGSRRMESYGWVLSCVTAGRAGRHADAATRAVALVRLEGGHSSLRTSGLINLGYALYNLHLLDAALECWQAALERERRLGKRPWGLLQEEALGQIMNVHALRGDRAAFEALYSRIDASAILPYGRVPFHRDAAAGLMRFGDTRRAAEELKRAQLLAEVHGFHYDWFQIEREIQQLRNVQSQGRDEAHLDRDTAQVVERARDAWQQLQEDAAVHAGVS